MASSDEEEIGRWFTCARTSRPTAPTATLKQFRRVATRFEKTARNFLAVVTIAAVVLWLR